MDRFFPKGAALKTRISSGSGDSNRAAIPVPSHSPDGDPSIEAPPVYADPGIGEQICPACDGMGMRVVKQIDGRFLARRCECREEIREAELLRRSRIPERHMLCTLENFDHSYPGADHTIWKAFNRARGFATNYPHRERGIGLLFTGSVGTGKTHLAVGILRALLLKRGVTALFCDHRGLLKAVNNSYNPRAGITEVEVLKPVFEAEVLVIDELGSAKKTEWVSDIVEHILNTRYNDHRTTIITTNYSSEAPGKAWVEPEAALDQSSAASSPNPDQALTQFDRLHRDLTQKRANGFANLTVNRAKSTDFGVGAGTGVPPAARKFGRPTGEETLGDRIGARMLSRLSEMCVTVELKGADYRQGGKKARFD